MGQALRVVFLDMGGAMLLSQLLVILTRLATAAHFSFISIPYKVDGASGRLRVRLDW